MENVPFYGFAVMCIDHPEVQSLIGNAGWSSVGREGRLYHVVATYEGATGRTVDHTAMRLHELWWDLCEVSLYIADFVEDHHDTEDTRTAWAGLQSHLDPTRWSDLL